MPGHGFQPQRRLYGAIAYSQQQAVIMGSLDPKSDSKLAPAETACTVRQESNKKIAVDKLQFAHNVIGMGMAVVINHHYLIRGIIVLRKDIGQQLLQMTCIAVRNDHYRHRRIAQARHIAVVRLLLQKTGPDDAVETGHRHNKHIYCRDQSYRQKHVA